VNRENDSEGDDAGAAGGDAEFDPVDFLDRAVPIASHEDVEPMTEFLVETLAAHGVAADVDDVGNVVASRGSAAADADDADDPDGTHLVLNTHLDTVSPHVPHERTDDEIRGRGACDAKGPLAAMVAAFLAVDPGDGRITLAVTPDEETDSTGAATLDLGADLYVVGEPTGLDVCHAGKGRYQGTATLRGSAAHAAEPESGTNAVAALEGALAAVRTFDDGRDPHPELGSPTLTPTVVAGGDSANQVAAECRLTLDRRPLPDETAEEFSAALTAALREAVPPDVEVSFDLVDRPAPFLGSYETPETHPLVETLAAAVADVRPEAGAVRPFGAACEASFFAPAPVVVFGPGVLADDEGGVAHADREYVRVDDVRAAARALTATVDALVG